MKQYTVFGVVNNSTWPPSLIVAAVVEGPVEAVDQESNNEETMRYASSFFADSPDEAESLAVDQVGRGG